MDTAHRNSRRVHTYLRLQAVPITVGIRSHWSILGAFFCRQESPKIRFSSRSIPVPSNGVPFGAMPNPEGPSTQFLSGLWFSKPRMAWFLEPESSSIGDLDPLGTKYLNKKHVEPKKELRLQHPGLVSPIRRSSFSGRRYERWLRLLSKGLSLGII